MLCCEKEIYEFIGDGNKILFKKWCDCCKTAPRLWMSSTKKFVGNKASNKLKELKNKKLITKIETPKLCTVSGGLCSGVGRI